MEKINRMNINGVTYEIEDIEARRCGVTPQQYGAKGDGVTDDTAAINACLAENSFVFFPKGVYVIDTRVSVQLKSNQTIAMDDNATLKANTLGEGHVVVCDGVENVVFRGGNVVGDLAGNEGDSSQKFHGFCIKSSRSVTVDGCRIYGHRGDGMFVGMWGEAETEYADKLTKNIKIVNCEIYDCARHGMFVDGIDGLLVKDTVIHDCNTFDYSGAIDLEIHWDWHTIHNIRLEGVKSYNTNIGVHTAIPFADEVLGGFEVDGCDIDRIVLQTNDNIRNSTIRALVIWCGREHNVYNCRIERALFKGEANECNFYNCVFGGENIPANTAIIAGETANNIMSNIRLTCVGCTFLTHTSDVRDYTEQVLRFNNGSKRVCFDRCTFFLRNPNGVGHADTTEEAVYTNCHFKLKHGFQSYGGWMLQVGSVCKLINNVFDTTEAPTSDKHVIVFLPGATGTMMNNVVLGKAYLGVIACDGDNTLTCIGNVFREYTDRWAFGNAVEGVVIDKIGNITSETTE